MGSAHAPAPVDYRVERCVKTFEMPQDKIEKLWHIFKRFDRDGTGYVNSDDLFGSIFHLKRSGLTDAMFSLIECKSETQINFGEFVELSCTFACFEKTELLRYFFFILDPNSTGLIEKNELQHFFMAIWHYDVNSNFHEAMEYLNIIDDGDGALNFKEICALQIKYPAAFFPLYNLQVMIIQNTLGEYWWSVHKAHLAEAVDDRKKKDIVDLKRKQKAAAKAADDINEDLVKKRMGFRYYFLPWQRNTERKRIAKIAAIEHELEQRVKNITD